MNFLRKKRKSVYLDYAAATPVDSLVEKAMRSFWSKKFFNPSSLYAESVVVDHKLQSLRKSVADILAAQPREITFTNGGTESNNLAIQGVVASFKKNHPEIKPHVIISNIEHPAVQKTARALRDQGDIELTELPVKNNGVLDPKTLKEVLQEHTVLISVMYVNNEIGTVQPIHEITKTVRWFKKHHNSETYPLVHTDAIQATQYFDINTARLGVDLMTLSAAKIYGPKGIALLFTKSGTPIEPCIYGGGQEYGMRGGTENIPLIVGMVKALEIANQVKEREVKRLTQLRDYFFNHLKAQSPKLIINGDREERAPNNVNISLPGFRGEQLVIELDAKGIMASTQSACSAGSDEISHVIQALRPGSDIIEGTLRFTMGRSTTQEDIDYTIEQLEKILDKMSDTEKRFREN